MKKLLILLLTLMTFVNLCACSNDANTDTNDDSANTEPEVVSYKDGTYEGSGMGKNGYVKVKVTVKDAKITTVEITEHIESEGIADPAIEKIPQAIVDAQSTEVETISGATVTANAICDAVNEALEAAK